MADYYEIDFHDVETTNSGDAISLRYEQDGFSRVHVVDGGYIDTGKKVLATIQQHYGAPDLIDAVVVTHNDGDHACGLRTVLEDHEVGELWMLRPWLYAEELLPRFTSYTSAERLRSKLRSAYSNLVALEEIAERKNIPIKDPFQGASIGHFVVLAPSRSRYLDLIVASNKTPQGAEESVADTLAEAVATMFKAAVSFIAAAWGQEVFSPKETSAENEMSVVQYANLSGHRILLTGDAGRDALQEAIDYAALAGLLLPGLDRIQVPHHGSRRNVSTEILDQLLGERLPQAPAEGSTTFSAIISSAKADTHHPRKSVIRAFIHRGGRVVTTENGNINIRKNLAMRAGWGAVAPQPYPTEQED